MKCAADNLAVVRTMRELAVRLAAQGSTFRARRVAKAAQSVEALPRQIADVWCAGGIPALRALPWVGAEVALWLVELVTSGQIAELEGLDGHASHPRRLSSVERALR